MKYTYKYKSPNYNSRNNAKIKLIIIHYTALKSTSDAISYLCKKDKKVSSHYLISQNGEVYNLVDDKFRAWHAGKSFWHDITDINSISIGIELDYNPYGKNNKFTFKMITSLKNLINKLKKKYKIDEYSILGHSDIAPFRKKDPGKHFPWKAVSTSKIFRDFKKIKKKEINIIEKWFRKNNIILKKQKIIFILSLLGYDTREVYNDSRLYNKLISIYKIKFLSKESIIKNKSIYDNLIRHIYNFMLTKI